MRRLAHFPTHEKALALRSVIVGIGIGIAAPQRGAASSDPSEPPDWLLQSGKSDASIREVPVEDATVME
jgi:hypothetical protein